MSRLLLPLPFRRLRWQLTLSYILITLVAALTLEVATTVASVLNPPKTPSATPAEILVNAMFFNEGPQLVAYLEQTPPDQRGLTVWTSFWAPGFTFSKLGFAASSAGAADPSSQIPLDSARARNVTVVILGPDERVLAAAPTATPSLSSINELIASPQAQATLHAALQTGKPLYQTATLADGRTIAAVPVMASVSGPVLGALLIAAALDPGPAPPAVGPLPLDQIVAALRAGLPSALAFVILASIIGTLFGVLTSRRITLRLGRITLAADSWSRGDFQTAVRDAGRDELGQLATDLNVMAAQLQRLLATRQELAVVEERHRLARDLHDSVKQQLFAVTLLLGSARLDVQEQPETERTLAEAEEIARQAQQELTGLIRALRPVALAAKGLCAAVRELASDWSRRTGIAITVQAPPDLTLPAAAEQELFRVVEEALSNAARHSGATQAEVAIVRAAGTVALWIADNGHGFDLDRAERAQASAGENLGRNGHESIGLGLRHMRERVEGLGGTFHLTSTPNGTRIEVSLPAQPEHVAGDVDETHLIAALAPAAPAGPESERREVGDAATHHTPDR